MGEDMKIAPEARSGDGSLENVGTKLDAPIQCHHCRQRFMDQRALELHLKFVYDPKSATAKLAE